MTKVQSDTLKAALGVEILVYWPDGKTPEEVIQTLDVERMRQLGWHYVGDVPPGQLLA